MRIVIDTNILVSAAIAGRKPASVITWIINQPDYEWVVSEEILAEYQEVLSRRKFKINRYSERKMVESDSRFNQTH